MTARNTYATLAEYKTYTTSRGSTATTDSVDDVVIDGLLEQASRYIETKTTRWFYPRIETRNYSIPRSSDDLGFDADVLEVITLLNGDASSIASTVYNLLPPNEYPRYGLRIKSASTVTWQTNSSGESEFVLALTAVFGYHNRYADAWPSAGTLGAAIADTTGLSITMTAGHTVTVGKILKIDSELFIVSAVVTNTVTVLKRGDNGSTAATHLINVAVYAFSPMEEARNAVLGISAQAYKQRFGQSLSNTSTITAAGLVLTPRDIPALAADFIKQKARNL